MHFVRLPNVRDDFWLAVTRLSLESEVDFVQGYNMALTDLFDVDHARKVLEAFGRAFGKLPDRKQEITHEQKAFLTQSVTGLAEEGRVIAVQLAVFAEMMRGRSWTGESLREIGGVAGVGLSFLDETFLGKTAPPSHRLHHKAIESVLEALLPERGSDLEGQMKSCDALMRASGYVDRPADFAALLRILDSGVRLITTTELNESATESGAEPARYYQLTHDFLVTPLRMWLTRKRRQTWRGRCELLLEERASLWSSRPEKQQLPSLLECAAIRCNTGPSSWTASQTGMMRVAMRFYTLRCTLALVLAAIGIFCAFEIRGRATADGLVASLLRAEPAGISNMLREIEPYRRWAIPRLREIQLSSGTELFNREVAFFRFEASQPDRLERFTKLLAQTTVVVTSRESKRTIAELLSGDSASLRNQLKVDTDGTLRTALIHQFEELGVPPVILVSLIKAEREDQFCYIEVGDGTFRVKPDHVRLPGDRLPELTEWKRGCADNFTTQFSFGDDLELLPNYAWYFSNSRHDGQHRAKPVGQMKPNTLGLFDTYGNVWEWVTRPAYPEWSLICGGSCDNDPVDLKLLVRENVKTAEAREVRVGFRIAQTVLAESGQSLPSNP